MSSGAVVTQVLKYASPTNIPVLLTIPSSVEHTGTAVSLRDLYGAQELAATAAVHNRKGTAVTAVSANLTSCLAPEANTSNGERYPCVFDGSILGFLACRIRLLLVREGAFYQLSQMRSAIPAFLRDTVASDVFSAQAALQTLTAKRLQFDASNASLGVLRTVQRRRAG